MDDVAAVVARFNDHINARDLDGLTTVMSDDHTFIDTAGHAVTGKRACLEAWRGFFTAYPDYRNVFEAVQVQDNVVAIRGYSVCPGHPDLEGPVLWTASVFEDRVTEWSIHDDTPQARLRLNIS